MRRLLRAALGVALLASLAGCAGFQPLEENAKFVVVNGDDETYQVLVEVTRDGTPVLREARAVRPDGSWSMAVPLEPVPYELHVSTDRGGETSRPFEVPIADDDGAYLQVEIAPDGSLSSRVLVSE